MAARSDGAGAMSRPARAAWTPARIAEWERLRAQGMCRFVWSYGVLRWGGFMFCFSMAVFQYSRFGSVFSAEGNWLLRVWLALATWTFVGYLHGRSLWFRNEREYADQRAGEDTTLRA
ncbi:hypothetical protein [Methylomagnum ishizawai]|uniref:hypothetical protein n=1 Tax=Methylomagnum ishizawai TaxID=1760988 RepID=UPI001C81844B|nr:hypothetical protein [Methylomagnum ishizawai]